MRHILRNLFPASRKQPVVTGWVKKLPVPNGQFLRACISWLFPVRPHAKDLLFLCTAALTRHVHLRENYPVYMPYFAKIPVFNLLK